MNELDTREWFVTNGLGSFASGTVCDTRTRTYHGWLIAALDLPNYRTLFLSHLEASLEIAGQVFSLGTNFWSDKVEPLGYQLLLSFEPEPIPTWTWGQAHWQLSRQILMPYGVEPEPSTASVLTHLHPVPGRHRIMVQYRYQGQEMAMLRLRPLIGDRNFHHHQQQRPGLGFSQLVRPHDVILQSIQDEKVGIPWQLRWTHGQYSPAEAWYWNYHYPEESERGLDALEDLYSPGYLSVLMQPGDLVTLEATVGFLDAPVVPLSRDCFEQVVLAEQQRLAKTVYSVALPESSQISQNAIAHWQHLLKARDQFIIYPGVLAEPRIIAGYHWFGDRSRDTLLCLPGFALTTGDFSLARSLLEELGGLCCQGLIPNELPDHNHDPIFRSLDCSLWWIEMLGLYLEASQDWEFLTDQYTVVKHIYKAFTAGTLHNIRIDASDGLITWDDANVPLTWMDAIVEGKPVTPRHGKPIEINALWYSALCWASKWATWLATHPGIANADRLENQARRYTQQAAQVKTSLQRFWNQRQGYLYDRIQPDDRLDATIRPNAVIALSLHHCGFTAEQATQVLQVARDRLLTPYGLRSLDPANPNYIGHYTGGLRQRDLAAHQGSVWSWLLGPFMRAWFRFCDAKSLAFDWEPLLNHFQNDVCLGGISEIFDGDAPHTPRGAIAYASPVAELIRCWENLELP